jgi:hypothetical protein
MATKKKSTTDERVDKRRVTMTNATALPDGTVATVVATDYVRPDFLDAYVADARTRWQSVVVSEEPDAGPAGYEGDTTIPAHIDGRGPDAFSAYGDASTPHNALDERLATEG